MASTPNPSLERELRAGDPAGALRETHILGPRTRQFGVRVDLLDPREWLADFPACALLHQHQIAHVGICRAMTPYRVVRNRQSGTYFLACVRGEGRILIDGRWQRCRAGMACLLPPRILNAFHAVPGSAWEFCWVRYQQPPEQRPVATAASPVLARFDAEPLRASIEGLYHEWRVRRLLGAGANQSKLAGMVGPRNTCSRSCHPQGSATSRGAQPAGLGGGRNNHNSPSGPWIQ